MLGPTGVWVVASWRRRRLLPGGGPPPVTVRGLRGQAEAVAHVLEGWARVPIRALLCGHSPWSVPQRTSGVLGSTFDGSYER